MTELNGAQVLVVGATGGLGSAIARQLVRAGATLTISGRSRDALQALADECCEGRLVSLFEGGYKEKPLRACAR
ncbi:MAG: SDR family NAD(P)-dependent oxidoreductase, partial [Mycobacterium sp.]